MSPRVLRFFAGIFLEGTQFGVHVIVIWPDSAGKKTSQLQLVTFEIDLIINAPVSKVGRNKQYSYVDTVNKEFFFKNYNIDLLYQNL